MGSTSTSTTSTTAPDGTTTTTVPEGPEAILPAPEDLSPGAAATLQALRGEYDDVAEDELDFFNRLLATQTLVDNLNAEIATVDLSIASVTIELGEAQAIVDLAEQRLADTEAELADATDELDTARGLLRRWAVEAYIAGGTELPASELLQSRSAAEATATATYADALAVDQGRAIGRVRLLREETERLVDLQARQRDAAVAARDLVAQRVAELERQRGQQARAKDVALTAAMEQQGLLAETAERRADYERRLAERNAVSDGIAQLLAARQADQVPPILTTAIFLPPIKDGRVVSVFGSRIHPVYGVARMHNGLDIDAPFGAPIRSAGDGEVVMAEVRGGYGNAVVVDHGNGIATLYAHMAAFTVEPGQRVLQGDILGAVGSTGLSTGPHLHWEVRVKGQPVNPLPYVGADR